MGLATPIIIANVAIAGGIFTVFLTTLFSEQGWLRWMWLWSIFQLGMVVYAFFEPSAASNLSMLAWRCGPPIFFAFLLTAAIRDPRTLRQLSNKVAFGVLSLSSAMFVAVSWKSGGVLGGHAVELTSDLFIQNVLSRTVPLLVIMGLATWFYERLKANQLHVIQNELQLSQESLDLESKRLERQRKFTAMLAHELKNPLAVSHLALSGIKARISLDDPLLQRSAAIEQSLQEIDAIIDRCSEMDGFEQGQLPMRIGAFTLNDLMAALKATHRSDRIYILVQGITSETVLVSDMHYLKIIFSNLLTNALKYSPPDTLVELAVQAVQRDGQAPMVSFCVSNEVGEAGTPSPDLAFERFYRAESARNQSGAGLGLWLSQSLAHALGTEVVMQIQSQKISFTLVLPCK
jgi:signal transduction histidine kinase